MPAYTSDCQRNASFHSAAGFPLGLRGGFQGVFERWRASCCVGEACGSSAIWRAWLDARNNSGILRGGRCPKGTGSAVFGAAVLFDDWFALLFRPVPE